MWRRRERAVFWPCESVQPAPVDHVRVLFTGTVRVRRTFVARNSELFRCYLEYGMGHNPAFRSKYSSQERAESG